MTSLLVSAPAVRCAGPRALWSLALAAGVCLGETASPRAPAGVRPLPAGAVRLLPGPFRQRQDVCRAYLLDLEPGRLLFHMHLAAGLPPLADASYGGWSRHSSGMAGHYLSACAWMAAATGDPALEQRVRMVVAEMARCQAAQDGGIYAGVWDARDWFPRLRRGDLQPRPVNPWYGIHKIMAGLRDAWECLGDEQARDVLLRLCDWAVEVTAALSPEQWQEMLAGEHGAPHEILADAYLLGGDGDHLACARRFRHAQVFVPLSEGNDAVLPGLHANTQIPKFIGYQRLYEVTGEEAWQRAARGFWESVASRHTWANGGNSQHERFFDPGRFSEALLDPCGPETCNTYNMLKLTAMLHGHDPGVRFVDYYEHALLNHILTAIDPGRPGAFVYYTPMRPGHYRACSTPENSMWCCVGTGMENPGRYGSMIYSRDDDGLYVNLFLPSELTLEADGIGLRQETAFPGEGATILSLRLREPRRFAVRIRCPGWTAPGGPAIRVNGVPAAVEARPGSYALLRRTWRDGDRIEIDLPRGLHLVPLPGDDSFVAVCYGPVLLAAALGSEGLAEDDLTVASETGAPETWKILPLDTVPVLVGTAEEVLAGIARSKGPGLRFRVAAGVAWPEPLELAPFYTVHRQRYAVYWPRLSPERAARELPRRAECRRLWLDLDLRTVDRVRIGDRASERAHGVTGRSLVTGVAMGHAWRHAGDGGWMAFQLDVPPHEPVALQCMYWGGDAGKRTFDILAEEILLATETLDRRHPGEFVRVEYPLPQTVRQGRERIGVRFQAKPGHVAGGLYDLRIVRTEQRPEGVPGP
ncbi:MAG: glycoside hydrolase family 127 protein [Lentisphaeria bacterium]|nr:glycoside hydrolase family 127 protein [Lentisphaeria bacterium]